MTGKSGNGRSWVSLQKPGMNVATWGFLGMVLGYLLVLGFWNFGGEEEAMMVYRWGGLSWEGIRRGELWTLVTHLFLHGGVEHLLLNGLLFYYAAARLSQVLTEGKILALFLISGVGAGLGHVLAQGICDGLPTMPLVGASGGIMGMLLGWFTLSPDSRMFLPVSAKNLSRGVMISSLFLFLATPGLGIPFLADLGRVLEVLLGDLIFRVAHLAHFLGGLLGILLIPRLLPRLVSAEDLKRIRQRNEERLSGRKSL